MDGEFGVPGQPQRPLVRDRIAIGKRQLFSAAAPIDDSLIVASERYAAAPHFDFSDSRRQCNYVQKIGDFCWKIIRLCCSGDFVVVRITSRRITTALKGGTANERWTCLVRN